MRLDDLQLKYLKTKFTGIDVGQKLDFKKDDVVPKRMKEALFHQNFNYENPNTAQQEIVELNVFMVHHSLPLPATMLSKSRQSLEDRRENAASEESEIYEEAIDHEDESSRRERNAMDQEEVEEEVFEDARDCRDEVEGKNCFCATRKSELKVILAVPPQFSSSEMSLVRQISSTSLNGSDWSSFVTIQYLFPLPRFQAVIVHWAVKSSPAIGVRGYKVSAEAVGYFSKVPMSAF